MGWNGVIGLPWGTWERDILIEGRQQDPPVPFKEILKQLPAHRTLRGAMREAHDLGLSKHENRAKARLKYPGREDEIFAAMQYCALDLRLCRDDARKWLARVKGIELSNGPFNKRVARMKNSTSREEQEVHRAFEANGKRVQAMKLSRTKKKEYREGKSNLVPGGIHRGKNARSKSEGQDQGDTEKVRVLVRTAGDAGHGAERYT